MGDLVLLEVLRGARDDQHAARIERSLRAYRLALMMSGALASVAAGNYRALRSRGITICKTIDLIIGTFCIVHDHALLQCDRDFQPMATHFGLLVLTC